MKTNENKRWAKNGFRHSIFKNAVLNFHSKSNETNTKAIKLKLSVLWEPKVILIDIHFKLLNVI